MTLHYEVHGRGDAILMIHGLGGSANMFEAQVWALRERFMLIRPDLPGFGQSSDLDAEPFDQVVDRLLALLDDLELDTVHCVGHSLGALLCRLIAIRTPERVRSLTLLGPLPEARTPMQLALKARATRVRAEGMRRFVEEYLTAALGPNVTMNQPAALAYVREVVSRSSPRIYADYCEQLAAYRLSDDTRIDHPALLVSGDADRIAPPSLAEPLSRSMQKSRVEVLPDCGHWSPLEAPLTVAELVRAQVSVANARQLETVEEQTEAACSF
jgi:pimeloyl-ACP methyl ester carboxylesterase